MSSDGLKRLLSNDGAKSPPSTEGAVGCRKVTGRSCSTDEGYDGEFVNQKLKRSCAFQFHSSTGDVTDLGLRTQSWTLPTNIVYGPQDVVRSTEDLQWSNPDENLSSLQEHTFTRNDALNPRILTRGPAKDFISRNMNRSRSMDEDYGSIESSREMCRFFPTDGNGFSSKDDKHKKKETQKTAIPSKEDSRVVTWGIAKTVPVTAEPSSSKDDERKKEAKKAAIQSKEDSRVVTWGIAKTIPVAPKRSSSKDEKHKKKERKKTQIPSTDVPKDVPRVSAKAVPVAAKRSSSKDEKHKKKETKKVIIPSTDVPKNVTSVPANAVPVAAKRSTPKDEKHKKNEAKKAEIPSAEDPKDATQAPAKTNPVTTKHSSPKVDKQKNEETKKGPTATSNGPKDVPRVSAKAVPVAAKRSSSKDEKHKKNETKKGAIPAKAVPVTPRRSTRLSSSKHDLYCPGRVEVLPTKRVTRSSRKAAETVSSAVERTVKISASKDEDSSSNEIEKKRGRNPVSKKVSVTVKRLSLKDKKYRAAKVSGELSTSTKGKPKRRDNKAHSKDTLPPVKRFTSGNEKYGALKVLRSLSTDSGGIQKKWDEKAFPKDTLPPVKRFTWANDEYSAPKMLRSASTDSVGFRRFSRVSLPPIKRFTWGSQEFSPPTIKRSLSTDSEGFQGFPIDTLPPVKRFTWGNEEYNSPKIIRSASTDSVSIQGFSKDTLPPIKRFTWGNEEYSGPKMLRSLSTDSGGIQKKWDEKAFPKDTLPPVKRFTWGSHSTDNLVINNTTDDKTDPNDAQPTFKLFTWRHLDFCATKLIRSFSTDSIGIHKKKNKKGTHKDAVRREKTAPKDLTPAERLLTSEDGEYSSARVARWPSTDSTDVQKKRSKKAARKDAAKKSLTSKDEECSAANISGWLPTDSKEIRKKRNEKTVSKEAMPPENMLTPIDKEFSAARVAEWLSTGTEIPKKSDKNTVPKDDTPPEKMLTSKDKKCSAGNEASWVSTDSKEIQKKNDEKTASKDETSKVLTTKTVEYRAARVARWPSKDSIEIHKKRNKKACRKDAAKRSSTLKDEECSAASISGWLPTDSKEIQKKNDEKTVSKDETSKVLTTKTVEYRAARVARWPSKDSTEIQTKRNKKACRKDAAKRSSTLKDEECSAASVSGWLPTDSKEIRKKNDENTVPKDETSKVLTTKTVEYRAARVARWPSKDSIEIQKKRNKKACRKDAAKRSSTSKDEECSAANISGWLPTDSKEIQTKRNEKTVSKEATPPENMLTSIDQECSAARVSRWLSTDSIGVQKKNDEKTVPKKDTPSEKMLTSKAVGYSDAKDERSFSTYSKEIQKKKAERTDSKDASPPAKTLTSKDKECSAARLAGCFSTDNKEIQKKTFAKDATPPEKEILKKKSEGTDSKDAQAPVKTLTAKDKECSAARLAGWFSTDNKEIQKKTVAKDATPPEKVLTLTDVKHSGAKRVRSLSTCSKEIQKKKAEGTDPKDAQPPVKILSSKDKECSVGKRERSLSTSSVGIQKKNGEEAVRKDDLPSGIVLTSFHEKYGAVTILKSIPTRSIWIQKKMAEKTFSKGAARAFRVSSSKDREYSAARLARSYSADCIEIRKNRDEHEETNDAASKILASEDVVYSGAKRPANKDAQTPVKDLTSKDEVCSDVMVLRSMVKRSRSMDDDVCPRSVTRDSRKDISSPRRSSKTKKSKNLGNVTRSLSHDSTASTSKLGEGVESSHCFGEEYYNTGLLKRSHSMDDDICPRPVTRDSRKDISSPRRSSKNKKSKSLGKATRSLSHDSTASTSKLGKGVESSHCFGEEYYNTGLLKRSHSMDDNICPRPDTRASRKDISNPRRSSKNKKSKSLGKVTRSLSHDSTASTSKLGEGVESSHCFGEEYYNTGLLKRSHSMDDDICPRPVTRDSRKDISSPRRSSRNKKSKSLGKVTRSLSHDSTASTSKLGEGVESSHCFGEEYYNTGLLKRSHSMDDDICPRPVTRDSRKDISSPRRSSKNKKSKSLGKATRSLSHDSTASTSKLGEGVESSHCFGEEYYSTGLLKRSHSMDDDICPRPDTRASRKDISSPRRSSKNKKSKSLGKVTRSQESTASSSKLGEGVESSHCFGEQYYSTGILKRSHSMDDDICPRPDTRASRKDISSPRRSSKNKKSKSLGKATRSLSHDSTASTSKLGEGVESSHCFGEEYSTGLLKRSHSMDDDICPRPVIRASRKDIPSPPRSSKTIKPKSVGKVTRLLNLLSLQKPEDSTASSTNVAEGVERRHCLGDRYYNTGLVRRSRSMDEDIWPKSVTRTSRKDTSSPLCFSKTEECSSLGKVKRSLPIGIERSTNSPRRGGSTHCFGEEYYSSGLLKRSRFMDDDISPRSVTQTSPKDILNQQRSSKTKKSKNIGKVTKSLFHDSTASSTNEAEGFEKSHCFGDKYYNTGLVRRSRSMDEDIWPKSVTRTSCKDTSSPLCFSKPEECSSLGKVKRSLPIGIERSTNSPRRGGSTHCFGEEYYSSGLLKRSRFMDDDISPRSVTQTSPKDILNQQRSSKTKKSKNIGKVTKSLFHDSTASSTNEAEGFEKSHCFGDKYYNTGLVRRSRSMDDDMWCKSVTRKDISSPRRSSKTKERTSLLEEDGFLTVDGTEFSTNSMGRGESTHREGQSNTGSMKISIDCTSSQTTDLVKRSRSFDDFETVVESNSKEMSIAVNRCASEDKACDAGKEKRYQSTDGRDLVKNVTWVSSSLGEVERSVSIDGTENSTNSTEGGGSTHCFGEEHSNTGSIKRSIDGTRSPINVTQTTDLVKRSRSLDDFETVVESNSKEMSIVVNRCASEDETSDAGKEKKYQSIEDRESIKRVRWASKTDLNNYYPGKLRRSVSTECSESSNITTWVPKSILKKTQGKIYYDTTKMPNSCSIDESCSYLERFQSEGDLFDIIKSLQTGVEESVKDRNPRAKTPSKVISWSLRKRDERSENHKTHNEHDNSSSKKMAISASKDNEVKAKKGVCPKRSDHRNTVDKCVTIPGRSAKAAFSKTKTSLPTMSSETSNAVANMNDNTHSTKVRRVKAISSTVETECVVKEDVPSPVKSATDTNKKQPPIDDDRNTTKLLPSSSWDEAITVGDRNTRSLGKRKRTASTEVGVEKKSTSECKSAPSKVKRTTSSDDAVNANPPKNERLRSNKAKKSFPRLDTPNVSKSKKRTASKEDDGHPIKIKRSHSEDDVSSSKDSKGDSGTPSGGSSVTKRKVGRQCNSVPSKVDGTSSSHDSVNASSSRNDGPSSNKAKKSFPRLDTPNVYKSKKRAASKEDDGHPIKIKRSHSEDDVSSSKDSKGDSGTPSGGSSVTKRKVGRQCNSAPSKVDGTSSSHDSVNASSSRNDGPSSNKAKKSFPRLDTPNVSKSKKIAASKEDAARPSTLKRSHTKNDVSSSRDSKRDSGTLSGGLSASKRKVQRPLKNDRSRSKVDDSSSEDSDSLSEDSDSSPASKRKVRRPLKNERSSSKDDDSSAEDSDSLFEDSDSSHASKRKVRRPIKNERSSSKDDDSSAEDSDSFFDDSDSSHASKRKVRRPLKNERSSSKDDDSSAEDSDSLFEDSDSSPASKRKVRRSPKNERSLSKDDDTSAEDSDSIPEDSDSSPEGNKFGNTDSSYKPKRHYSKKSGRDGYDCEICSKPFAGITDLRRHLLIHANEKPHVCEICQKSYRQNVNLRNHMKVEHYKSKEFECPFCMKPFALKLRLKIHLRIHIGEKQFFCPKCPRTFTRNTQLANHLKSHGMIGDNTCAVCEVTCETERSLKLHMERHMSNDNLCLICKVSFENEEAMRSHMSLSHVNLKHFECQICEKQIQDDPVKHMETHAKVKRHECEVCKKVFAHKTQYTIHMRTHTGERPFQCRVCWQNFGHSNVLKLHIRKHTGEKPFKCVLCTESPFSFSQLSHLKTHLKAIHKQDSAYICQDCKMSFKKKFHLDAHVKTCDKVKFEVPTKAEEKLAAREADELAQLRYLMAVLLKKISSREKLAILGFEKRLIDNVLIAALKLSGNKVYDTKTIHPLDQMKLNIQTFLEWTVPKSVMNQFKMECPSVESILEKIVALYLKTQVG